MFRILIIMGMLMVSCSNNNEGYMTRIVELTEVDALQSSDQFPLHDASNGSARKASLSTMQTYMQDNLVFSTVLTFTTQRVSLTATGFSVQVTGTGISVHLVMILFSTYATGTIVLPSIGSVVDKQEVLVTSTEAITTLTIDGNGAVGVSGAPTTMTADGFFTLKYNGELQTWLRVG